MGDLGAAMSGQAQHGQGSRTQQAEQHDDELGDVRQLHDNPVARCDAEFAQPGGHPIGRRVEFGVAEPFTCVVEQGGPRPPQRRAAARNNSPSDRPCQYPASR